MTKVIRRHYPLAIAIAIGAIGAISVLPLVAARDSAPRQLVLVARGMAFVIDGQAGTNPVLTLTAGERVEIVLRNETPGMAHDFAIPAWNVGIDKIGNGESTRVIIDVPATTGSYAYQCRPHAQMMAGVVEVVAP